MGRAVRRPELSDRWKRDLPQVAQLYTDLWARGVMVQHDRILSGPEDPERQLIDAMLYLVCLRNLLRAADLVHDVLSPNDSGATQDALDEFNDRCPDVKKARNWIEHFDEYALGLGRDPEAMRGRTPLRVRLTGVEDALTLTLTARGRTRRVDLTQATDAAVDLWLDLDQADVIVDESTGDDLDEED